MIPKRYNVALAQNCVRACANSYLEETLTSDLAHCLITRHIIAAADSTPANIIAFRGSASLRDWITDFNFPKTNLGFCCVHQGFWFAIKSIIDQVKTACPKANPIYAEPYYVTGHSLGGALAVLCAFLLAREGYRIEGVYTFGGPRVGDARFAKAYGRAELPLCPNIPEAATQHRPTHLGDLTFRLVDQEDIVARVPFSFLGFRHVGREIFFPSIGNGPVAGASLWFKVLSDVAGTWWDWKQGRIGQFADHPISRYCDLLEKPLGPGAAAAIASVVKTQLEKL